METRVLNNLKIQGSVIMAENLAEFPANPAIGTMVIKDQALYAYIRVGSLETWYPFSHTTRSYIHTQGLGANTWTVEHNLGTTNVWMQVQDPTGNIINVGKTNVDTNSFTLHFTFPTTGTVLVVAPDDLIVPTVTASIITVGNVVINSSGITIDGEPVGTATTVDGGEY